MKAVILAAGRGTRLGALTKDTPKPMIQVAGKPLLEHIIRFILRAGVSEFVLVTRYLSEKIEEYFGDGSCFGAHIDYVQQGDDYGTGAALLCARDLTGGEPLMMTYSDIVMPASNYAQAIKVFGETGGAGVITVNLVGDPCTGADVQISESGTVKMIVEKPAPGSADSYLNSSGLFVFEPIVFDYLERLVPSERGEYELPDAMNAMIADGLAIYPNPILGAWRDVGRVEDIAEAEKILLEEGV